MKQSDNIKHQAEDWIVLNTDGLDYIARLNKAIKLYTEETCKEDTTNLEERTATASTRLRAIWLKIKSR